MRTVPLEIITVESPKAAVLRRRAKPAGKVTRDIQNLIESMLETMRAARGIGLAAPQVGESVRVMVAEVEDRTVVLVDPEVLEVEGEETATEACLSIPGILGDVPRATAITMRGKNRRGRRVTIVANGFLARVLQHELDHLDGILFLDRVRDHSTIRDVTDASEVGPAAE
ncbi:MAG: peptide deformylase [Armatimonadota bacterium]